MRAKLIEILKAVAIIALLATSYYLFVVAERYRATTQQYLGICQQLYNENLNGNH